MNNVYCIHPVLSEMLERAFVKRLRDSDSDSEEESNSLMSKSTSEDKPTDILTTDKTSEVRTTAFSGVKFSYCVDAFSNVFSVFISNHEFSIVVCSRSFCLLSIFKTHRVFEHLLSFLIVYP